MAITTTTLGAALNARDLTFTPTATTGATVDGYAKIENEWMVVTAVPTGGIQVRSRGALGSIAAPHPIYAPVLFCVGADIPTPGPAFGFSIAGAKRDIVSYAASGAIAIPTRDTVALITKSSAAAEMTLADPTGVADGTMLIVASTTAKAHTITLSATGLDGTADTQLLTFGAETPGFSITLMAYKGLWAEVNVAFLVGDTVAVLASATA